MEWYLCQYLNVFSDFYDSLKDDELQAEIDQRLERLRQLGNMAKMPVSEPLGGGVFACRADSAQHRARMLYCFRPGRRIVVVLCVLKDQPKIAPADIAEARKRKAIIEAYEESISGIHKSH
jgi:putative component of toxin-antitoxin plasmid stabilization module